MQLVHGGEQAEPKRHIAIPQTAGSVLDVRFEMEDGVAELFMAAARNLRQPLQQRLRLAGHQLWNDFVVQAGEQIVIAGKIAAVEQRDRELDIGGIEAVALVQNAGGRTQLQAQIPQALRKASNPILESLFAFAVGVKKKQIDIGVGKKPTAAESTQSNQRKLPWTSFLGSR